MLEAYCIVYTHTTQCWKCRVQIVQALAAWAADSARSPLRSRSATSRSALRSFFSDCSAHLNFWPAPLRFPLRSGSTLMLCSCSYVCANVSGVRYPHKCSFTWHYYIYRCNTRYAPNRRIWHLKFQNFGPPRREGATPSRTHPQHGLSKKRSPKSKIATTPLSIRRVLVLIFTVWHLTWLHRTRIVSKDNKRSFDK